MSIDLTGYVLRPSRSAPSNATSTAATGNGVLRDNKDFPGAFPLPGDLVELAGDQYRSAVIDNPASATQEYIVWAANSSNLALLEDTTWATSEGTGSIPSGTLPAADAVTLQVYTDGTSRLVITDDEDRSIADVRSVWIIRGDNAVQVTAGPDTATPFASQDADAGIITLSGTSLTALSGGVSNDRGDRIQIVSYVVAAARFWWSRNDERATRFGWNGKTQRWEPLKGTPPVSLGQILEGEDYLLTPKPTRFVAGDSLPGDSGTPDAYAMVRMGLRPDANSTPVDVVVVTNDEADATYTFAPGGPDAVVGATSGVLQWNPDYITSYAGQYAWYVYESFQEDQNGELGDLMDAGDEPLFITPLPELTSRPFIRLGFRRYLTPLVADNDAVLAALTVNVGDVGWSASTGKLKFNSADVEKADPTAGGFDVAYLGCKVYYDGVSLTAQSIRARDPVQLVDEATAPDTIGVANDLYIPRAVPHPSPGVSGYMLLPDGTGTIPNTSTTPATRPNGTGLVREVRGLGDILLFTKSGLLDETEIVEFESDLPTFPFLQGKGKATIAREEGPGGCRVALGLRDRTRFSGEAMYFQQTDVQPSVFAPQARILSREHEPFVLEGTEFLAFSIDGTDYLWDASVLVPGTYTAVDIATSLNSLITGTGSVEALNSQVLIQAGNLDTGSVYIGYQSLVSGAFADRNLTGNAILGFLPGWSVVNPAGNDNWLPDSGASLGVYRSPQNKDRSNGTPDMKARDRFRGTILSGGVTVSPFLAITNPPLQDVAGLDSNVFFSLLDGLFSRPLQPLEDVLYEFEYDRVAWLEQDSVSSRVELATTALQLGHPGVVGDTLYPAVAPGNGLYVSEAGGAKALLTQGVDYLLPDDGKRGVAILIDVVGGLVTSGAQGGTTAATGTFTDPDATFITQGVTPGFRLKLLSGDAAGSYVVTAVISEQEVTVTPSFLSTASLLSWKMYSGYTTDVYDPGLLADVLYEDFNHLPTEPFKARLLSSVSAVPADAAAQAANRRVAVVTDAIRSSRITNIRFGLPSGSVEADTYFLANTDLGAVANNTLAVPDTTEDHFTTGAFSILVGTQAYTITGGNLTAVAVFTPIAGDEIQYGQVGSGIEGELNFGATTLSILDQSHVTYVEEFLNPIDFSAGMVEIDPASGELNYSSADMLTYGSTTTAYFQEEMVTVRQEDVLISPMGGTVYFNTSLRENQIVEMDYSQANSSGLQYLDDDGNPVLVVEQLPLYVRQEQTTRVSGFTYDFNPTTRTTVNTVTPYVWVDGMLQNYGYEEQYEINWDDNEIHFSTEIASTATVLINYAVTEAFGGEQVYTASTTPVFRPPFFVEAEEPTFTLQTDRTTDMVPGKLLRLGAAPFYIKAASYSAVTGLTSVTLFPTPEVEAGSRAPGNDVLSLITTVPVTTDVDGVVTAGSLGFLLTLSATYEPVDKGMDHITFHGDVTQYAVPGHMLEMDGYPYLIVGGTLAEDGLTTLVQVSSPFYRGFNSATDVIKISVRPLYPPNARNFLGVNPLVPTEDMELVLYGETDRTGFALPGRTLTPRTEYNIDPDSGAVSLLEPLQAALSPGQTLYLSYTQMKQLQPIVAMQTVVYPLYSSAYSYVTMPSDENGFLGSILQGTYTYHRPDTFYFRAVPVSDYMGEVAADAVAASAAALPHSGPVVTSSNGSNNWDYGNLPLQSEIVNLENQDHAARRLISMYDGGIRGFEQVAETISGDVIGARDGKFRFFVGRNRPYAPQGYEDQITGILNPRNVWSQVFLSANQSFGVTETDNLVDPETATLGAGLVVGGDFLEPFLFSFYQSEQRRYIQNDIDDRVLVRRARPTLSLNGALPGMPSMSVKGLFQRMGETHTLSRLFPESSLVFTTTYPGLQADLENDDPGVYAFFRVLPRPGLLKDGEPITGSTFRQPIGSLSNPSLGVIENVTDALVRNRLPRARIWAYSPTGFPDVDAASDGIPSIIATPLQLKDFPIDPDTGWPDIAQMVSNGGELSDLGSGDVALSTPAWAPYVSTDVRQSQVAFGEPDGEVYSVGDTAITLQTAFTGLLNDPIYGGIFVGNVLSGCVLTFVDSNGAQIADASQIARLTEGALSSTTFAPVLGDTIYVIPPTAANVAMSDPPTVEELQDITNNMPVYRRGFDIGVQKQGGSFIDLSLPSILDPSSFWFKELLGQQPPDPMTTIEADVEFSNSQRYPHTFPALLGQTTNDSGDYAIPYLAVTNTELTRLGDVAGTFTSIVQTDTLIPSSVFPDEVLGNDGAILPVASGSLPPATLLTSQDFLPVTTAGVYTPHSGIGDVSPFDVVLVEVGSPTAADGQQGILSVGAVGTNQLEVPRFVTQTALGQPIWYTFHNAMSHVSTTFVSGMVLSDTGAGVTTIDINSMGALFFNDGTGGVAGGLNNIIPAGSTNEVVIRIYDNGAGGAPGVLQETITLTGTTATGGLGTVNLAGPVQFTDKVMTILTAAPFSFVNLPGVVPGPTLPYDFTITIDVYAAGAGAGSTTGQILNDRLTFTEQYDMSTAPARGATTAAGVVLIEAGLEVPWITASGVPVQVNGPLFVNAGVPFTFLPRDAASPQVGTFVPAPSPGELGTIKVMAWEAGGNVDLPSTSVVFSALPSSAQDPTGVICTGTGTSVDDTCSITTVSVPVDDVLPGDIAVIDNSVTGDAAVKAGTYLIRHAVHDSGAGHYDVQTQAGANSLGGWLNSLMPKVVSCTFPVGGAGSLVVDGIQDAYGSPTGTAWDTAGYVYVLVDPADLTTVVRAWYSAYAVAPSGQATFTLTDTLAEDATGAAIVNTAFAAAAVAGKMISGMSFLRLENVHGLLPSNSIVGFDDAGTTWGGILGVVVENLALAAGPATHAYGGTLADVPIPAAAPAPGDLGVVRTGSGAVMGDSTAFIADTHTPVYNGVAVYLDIRGIDWDTFHGVAGTGAVGCIVPGDTFALDDGAGNPGFQALAGIFLEPSWPRPARNLGTVFPKVVDATHTIPALVDIGMRNAIFFGLPLAQEDVSFTVRRIRRFHSLLDGIGDNLKPLRYAYEIRTGTVDTYTAATRNMVLTGDGTQLGGLWDRDVNVTPGDTVRLLDNSGALVDEAEIAALISNTSMILREPGFTETTPAPGDSIQIWLKQAPVPHEQSNEQLLDFITETVVFEQTAVPNSAGGAVTTTNQLTDFDGTVDFSNVQQGDIILVDPAGALTGPTGPAGTPETGATPYGDQSVLARADGSYVAGGPSELDDNRGWYRVSADATPTMLEVSGATEFTGISGGDVVFGAPTQEFAVYPTINASVLTGSIEGQMDLRLTRVAGTDDPDPDSYQGNAYSISPFSYKIIRPRGILLDESVDLILHHRERILSWMEEITVGADESKQGGYYVFQRDEHISDLGSPTVATEGLGVPSNLYIEGLSGLTQYAPFANVSDCLSVLDRRVWCLDTRLDSTVPPYQPGGEPYTSLAADNSGGGIYTLGSGRPVLPDRIDDVLDRTDRLRNLRMAWIKYRTEKVSGTVPSIDRFQVELAARLLELEELLRIQESMSSVE